MTVWLPRNGNSEFSFCLIRNKKLFESFRLEEEVSELELKDDNLQ